jgi:pyruvate kinase
MHHKSTMVGEPTPAPSPPSKVPCDEAVCLSLLEQLWTLRKALQTSEHRFAKAIHLLGAGQQSSARNLAHYLAFRATDLRAVQEKLAWLGVSSLGRAESHVMASLDKVLGILHRLTNQPWQDHSAEEPAGSVTGAHLLQSHADSLLGPANAKRHVRIMVTLGTEAATDYSLVCGLVEAGMDLARINCAHDDAVAWRSMARLVRRAAKAAHRDVKILMDLGGPKVRTGPMAPGPCVVKIKPRRDALGSVISPSRLWLGGSDGAAPSADCEAAITMDADWIDRLQMDGCIELTDARGKKRRLRVVQTQAEGAIAECQQTYYLTPDVGLRCKGLNGHDTFTSYPVGCKEVTTCN